MSTADSGFRKTGIWPVDKNVFDDSDFLPSSTTDIPVVDEVTVCSDRALEDPRAPEQIKNTNNIVVADESMNNTPDESPSEDQLKNSLFHATSPEQLFAIPKVYKKNKRKPSARRGKTVIFIDSPYTNELMEDMEKQDCLKLLWVNKNFSQKVSNKQKSQRKSFLNRTNLLVHQTI